MITDFLMESLLAGFLFALISGPLGSVMVWRRLSFLGDTLAHAGLLGVALAAFAHVPIFLGIFSLGTLIVFVLIQRRFQKIGQDAVLTVLSQGSLGLGLLALSFAPGLQQGYTTFLFGDILAVQQGDLWHLLIADTLILCPLIIFWRPIMTTIVSDELAKSDGLPVLSIHCLTLGALVLMVSISIKIFGALLITALMIIPAVAARQISKSPGGMMAIASAIAFASIATGLWGSALYDLPTTPAIVSAAFLIGVILKALVIKLNVRRSIVEIFSPRGV